MTDQSNSPKHGALASPTPPPGAAEDWTVPQRWEDLTAEDHWVWDTLFARQRTLLHGRANAAFEEGLDVLSLSHPGVPDLAELNDRLHKRTNWTVVSVPGLVPDKCPGQRGCDYISPRYMGPDLGTGWSPRS